MSWWMASVVLLCSADPQWTKYQETQVHMGTSFQVVFYSQDEATATQAMRAAFARIQQLDATLSDYKEESELSRLSAAAPTAHPVALSDDLFQVLRRADDVSRSSDGAFDVTVGPLTRMWRRSRRQRELPTEPKLREALAAVGYQQLKLDFERHTAELLRPQMRLDLGGIGQGFAADAALKVLREQGISKALINASGDLAIGDAPPGEAGWKVGIAPLDPQAAPSRFLQLARTGISTSGDAFQFVEIGGQRYSHIVDPRTGLGLTQRMSVTIIAPDGTAADAWATALCVLGKERALQTIDRQPQMAALLVLQEDGQTKTYESRRWQELAKP